MGAKSGGLKKGLFDPTLAKRGPKNTFWGLLTLGIAAGGLVDLLRKKNQAKSSKNGLLTTKIGFGA